MTFAMSESKRGLTRPPPRSAVDADVTAGGDDEGVDGARLRGDLAVLVDRLRVHPHLHGEPVGGRRVLERQVGQAAAQAHTQLSGDEIDAGDLLRHRVLDLQARVHFHEVESAVRDEEFDGRERGEVDGRCDAERRRCHPGAQLRGERGAGGDLDNLLVAPLHGAVALTQVLVRRAVADHLELDVVGVVDVLLDEVLGGAEVQLRLSRALLDRSGEVVRVGDAPQAAPAAAGGRLDHDVAVLAEELLRLLERGVDARGRHDRHPRRGRQLPGARLVPEDVERLR